MTRRRKAWAMVAGVLAMVGVGGVGARPAAASPSCSERYVMSGGKTRLESPCTGWPRGHQARLRYATGINQYAWTYGGCVGNGATSYTLFVPNVVEGGTWGC